jgi:hypothetical protein
MLIRKYILHIYSTTDKFIKIVVLVVYIGNNPIRRQNENNKTNLFNENKSPSMGYILYG